MKYESIITLFLRFNPTPSDAQYHSLANALGVDKEELEAEAYEMLGIEKNQRLVASISRRLGHYRPLVVAFARHVPKPTLGQIKCLATAIDEDVGRVLQSCGITAVSSEHDPFKDNVNDATKMRKGDIFRNRLKGTVDIDRLSHSQRALSDRVDEDTIPYYDAALTDGSRDDSTVVDLQRVLKDDGGFVPDPQDANDDGVPTINLRQLVATRARINSAIDDADSKRKALSLIRESLRRLDMDFKVGEPNHLYITSLDVPTDCEDVINELNKQGHKFRHTPEVLKRRQFAVRTPDGLVIQRLGQNIRIFYSK